MARRTACRERRFEALVQIDDLIVLEAEPSRLLRVRSRGFSAAEQAVQGQGHQRYTHHERNGAAGRDYIAPFRRHLQLSIAVAHRAQQVDLLPQVVADDVVIPALCTGFDQVTHEGEQPRDLALRRSVRRWGRVEPRPTVARKIGLDPGVRVPLANGVEVAEAVVRAADEAGGVAAGY